MKPLIASLIFSFLLTLVAVGIVASRAIDVRVAEAHRGWRLKPVLVASRDLKPGETLTADAISQAQLPEQFVTESTVAPFDQSKLVGKKPGVALFKGDVFVWQAFVEADGTGLECIDALREGTNQAGTNGASASVDRFDARQKVPLRALPAALASDAVDDTYEVVVAAADLEQGVQITRRGLTTRRLPAALATASLIPARLIDAITEAQAAVPLKRATCCAGRCSTTSKCRAARRSASTS